MKRTVIVLAGITTMTTGSLGVAGATQQLRHHVVVCQKVTEAIAAGKTPEDVAKELGVSSARVKACTDPSPKRQRRLEKGKAS